MSELLRSTVDRFHAGSDVDPGEAERLLDEMIGTSDRDSLDRLFRAWREKGIAETEIYELARALRERCVTVASSRTDLVDIVGTGGGSAKSFNVSTAAAFVVAGAGLAVAKHGNRAATSQTGSTDVLAQLGIQPVDAAASELDLERNGICFMFAPNHHRLSKTLAEVRRGLGFPTIFNCVGPLCNPASAPHQLIGVWDRSMLGTMANALARLGTKRSWLVHADSGLDEISATGQTCVVEVFGDKIREFTLQPRDFGVAGSSSGLSSVASATESAALVKSILDGTRRDAARVLVAVNAAAALHIAGRAADLHEGLAMAAESIDSGSARRKLATLSTN